MVNYKFIVSLNKNVDCVGWNVDELHPTDWREVITQAVEMIGIDNSDKFFKPETPISQMFTQLEQMLEQMQQQLAPVIQQAIQGFMQNMQMQQMQQQAQQLPVNGGV